MNKYTVVIVSHEDEYDALCFQARSFARYMPAALIDQIVIVENPQIEEKHGLLDAYGPLRDCVTFIAGPSIAPPETFTRTGWYSQQVLKLLASYYVNTESYLVLDTKNVLVHPLKKKFLETWTGKPRSYHVDYTTHTSMRWLRNTLDYFELPESHAKTFMPTTTPFVLVRDLVERLINYVEHRDRNASFVNTFYKHNMTEFFAYSAYLIRSGQMCYCFSGQECKTVWDRLHGDDYVHSIIEETKQHDLPFFSVHRRAVPALSQDARQEILEFWQSRDLDGSVILSGAQEGS